MNIEVLKFSATWCNPCKVLSQNLKNVEGITNIDIEKNIETAIKYNVRQVPTIVFLKDEKEIHRVTGSISLKNYNEILDEIILNK